MKILIVHNFYQQAGGEDAVVNTEYELLKKNGQDVCLYERSNKELQEGSVLRRMNLFVGMSWSRESYRDFRRKLREFRPEVAHFHNIFYLLTPSVYDACRDEGVAVVQSQHNFRPLCANALFFRGNRVCEDCREKSLWEGVRHRCFQNSYVKSALMAGTLAVHQWQGTWQTKVDRYITATEFTRQKLIQSGFPAEKIAVKPHVVPPAAPGTGNGGYALYVGRLSTEKGVETLLKAWAQVPDVPLRIMGGGPLEGALKEQTRREHLTHVQFLGFVSPEQYVVQMRGAQFLVVPSICYENFPRIIVEAYSFGLPVIASRLGSMAEIVADGKTGVLFEPGNAKDLAKRVDWLAAHPRELTLMRQAALAQFAQEYGEEKNFQTLMKIYQEARAAAAAVKAETSAEFLVDTLGPSRFRMPGWWNLYFGLVVVLYLGWRILMYISKTP